MNGSVQCRHCEWLRVFVNGTESEWRAKVALYDHITQQHTGVREPKAKSENGVVRV